MKSAIPSVFFLILAASASAAIYEEQIFSEEITSSGTYTASNGENFTITLIGDYINIWLSGSSVIVKNNTCDNSGLFEICLLINEFSHYNYTGPERVVNKRDVTITTRVAKLNLTREIKKTEFWVGEETELRMHIQNLGASPASASFIDNFSDSFEVAIPLNCDLKGNAVVWKGELASKEVATCSYVIKAAKAGTFSSSATASYNNGVLDKTETDSKTLTVKDFPLTLDYNISNQSLELGSEVTAKFEMNASENMTVKSLKVALPDGLKLRGWNGVSRLEDGTLEYEGNLDVGEGHEFTITFAAEKTGTLPITETTKLVLTDSKTSQNFERRINVNVSVDELYTRLAKSNFSEGKNTLSIFVVNPSNNNFYDVEMKIETNILLANKDATFSKVSLLGHQEFSESFDAEPRTYSVNTTISYSSLYGEKFSVKKTESIIVFGETATGSSEEQEIAAAPETPQQEQQEPEKIAIPKQMIKKSSFSAKAAIFATLIVVIVAGIIVFISARRQKYEEDEF